MTKIGMMKMMMEVQEAVGELKLLLDQMWFVKVIIVMFAVYGVYEWHWEKGLERKKAQAARRLERKQRADSGRNYINN